MFAGRHMAISTSPLSVDSMRVFVINLKKDSVRRLAAERQLNDAGIEFHFYTAVEGDDARAACFDGCDDFACIMNIGRFLTDGEYGCFASHRRLWQISVDNDEPLLILEDDFCLQQGFSEAVYEVDRNIGDFGFIRLQTDLRASKRRVKDCGRFRLSRFTKAPHATLCYAISPAVALTFLEKTRVIDAPVDVFIKKFWEHEQALFALTPYTVVTSELALDSTIAGRVKRSKPFLLATLRFLTKCDWYTRRFLFNVRSLRGENRRFRRLTSSKTL